MPSCLLPCLVIACSGTAEWGGRVEVRDGVEVVSNPGTPLLDDAQRSISERWAVQGDDWEDPTLVHVGSGFLAVVDPRANRVHLVTDEGELLTSLGRPGGGPGGFLRLVDAYPDGDGLAVLDLGRGGIQYLALDGAYRTSLPLVGAPWGGFPMDDGEWFVKGEFLSDPREETSGDWIRVMEGREPIPFTPPPMVPLPEEQGVACSDLYAWPGGAARLRFTTPQVEVFDRTGALVRETSVELPVEPVSEAERESALADLRRRLAGREGAASQMARQLVIVMERRWRVKCRFGPLRFDPSGRLAAFLEQNPDEFGSGNAVLHFLSREGVYLAKATFPGAWRDFTLNGGVIYALTRDAATDLVTLRAYDVSLPDALLSTAAEVLEEARQRATEGR